MGTELRGRDPELETLRAALDALGRGSGSVALLEGEAGIGKTRLLDALCDEALVCGIDVHRGAGEELESDRPFGPLIEALGAPDGAVPTARQGGGSVDARFLAQDAFLDLVESLAAAGPMLLAIDDAHWVDRATVATTWALARRSHELGVLLVVAMRPAPRTPELARLVDGCRRLVATQVALGPIDDGTLVEIIADVSGAAPAADVLERLQGAAGNPFLALELFHAIESSTDDDLGTAGSTLPAEVRGALLQRVTGLDGKARQALSVAAVLGGAGRLEDIAVLLGTSIADAGSAVADATKAGLLDPAGQLVAFRHDLIREALYDDLPEAVRAGWHRAAAGLLEGRAEPAIVARHLVLGATRGDPDAVAGLARAATDLAGRQPDAAAELFDRALELAVDPSVRPELGTARASALLRAGRTEEAMHQADDVLNDRAAPPALVARAHVVRGNACFHLGRPSDAVGDFTAALATGALGDEEAANALGHQAMTRMWTYDHALALREADVALAEGERLGIVAVQVEALAARCEVHNFRAEPAIAIPAGQRAVALVGDDAAALRRTPHTFLALALQLGDRIDDARAAVTDGLQRAAEYGQVLVLRSYYLTLQRIEWFAGRWDDALAAADTADRLAEDYGIRFGVIATDGVKGLIAHHRGDAVTAETALVDYDTSLRGGQLDSSGSELLVLLHAKVLEANGDMDAAAAVLLEHSTMERRLEMSAARLWPGPTCVRLALAAGEHDAADGVAGDLDEIAVRAGTTGARAAALHASGLVADDASLLDEAANSFSAVGRPLDELDAREAAGEAYARAGRPQDAIARLSNALTIAEGLGAARDARRITAALRALGVRGGARGSRQRATTGWDALTDAEREVARLINDGLRNGEIAQHLFVSRRTVESHVSRLYAKLQVDTRVALANAIRERLEQRDS